MRLENYNHIAQMIAAIAVVISMIYVATEVRQNTQAMRLEAGNYAAEQARTLFRVAASPDHRELVFKAWQDPESIKGIDMFGYFGIMHDYFRTFENVYYQAADGALDPRLWGGLQRGTTYVLTLPGVRNYWEKRRDWYSDEFQSFVDRMVAEHPEGAFPLAGT